MIINHIQLNLSYNDIKSGMHIRIKLKIVRLHLHSIKCAIKKKVRMQVFNF